MMNKEKRIVYNYLSRSEVINEAVWKTLDEIYALSYPKPEKSFRRMCDDITEEAKKAGKQDDENFRLSYCDGKYQWPIDFFYIPQHVLQSVWDNRKEAYGVELHWQDNLNQLSDFLFVEPGFKEVYGPTKWSGGESLRHSEKMVLLNDIIGEKNANKVKEVLKDYSQTYKYGLRDVNQFAFGILSTPTCNKETVVKAWKEAFDIDIETPDDDMWMDCYEYSDLELTDTENE